MSGLKKLMIAVVSVAVIGFSVSVWAHGRWQGEDQGAWRGCRAGMGFPGEYADEDDAPPLTREQYQQMDAQRTSFLNETRELRADLIEKMGTLQKELAREKPDISAASRLQKEVSELQARLAQKRIKHMVDMRKLDPRSWHGWMHGRSMMGGGQMMMGFGMKPGMRGPGMRSEMARGMRSGMGPGAGYGGCRGW